MNAPKTLLEVVQQAPLQHPADVTTRFVSHCLWLYRGKHEVSGEAETNWESAGLIVNRRLRPYLAIDACVNGLALAQRILADFPGPSTGDSVWLVILGDGAFERAESLVAKHRNNGIGDVAESKDGLFARRAYEAVIAFGGHAAGMAPIPESISDAVRTRLFQDGFVVHFDGAGSGLSAVACSLSLHQSLNEWNEENRHDWRERVHARVSIARSLDGACALSQHVKRACTLVDPELELPDECKVLASAAGVRYRSTRPNSSVKALIPTR